MTPIFNSLLVLVQRHKTTLHRLGVSVSVLLISLSLFVFAHTLMKIDLAQFVTAFHETASKQIGISLSFVCLSYIALIGYDALALRYLGEPVPYLLTMLASFASYAIALTLGFPLVTGGIVRFWLYGPAGLSPSRIASVTLIAGISFWLGMGLVLAAGFVFDAHALGGIDRFSDSANSFIGYVLFAALALYLFFARGRRVMFNVRLPGFWLTVGQIGFGVLDVCAAAASLYTLLPGEQKMSFLAFAALYSFASLVGIASHAPGGLGVFEATMLNVLSGSPDRLLASLLLFRIVYYLLPFSLAVICLGVYVFIRRRYFQKFRSFETGAAD